MVSQEFIAKHLYKRSILSYLLLPPSLLFLVIQFFRRLIYKCCPVLSFRSSCSIISVGNIISGGSGKTPFTIFLTRHLSDKGKKVAVSHRGYKGNYEKNNKLISDRKEILPSAELAGDEAFLLAEKLPGIPIIAGKNRKRSINLLLKKFPDLDYIILDDSFQHLKVRHDFDFITINGKSGLGNGFVLPAGILREPASVLAQADYIVYNGRNELPRTLTKFADKVIKGEYRVKGFYTPGGADVDIEYFSDKKIGLLSGIGNPGSFEYTIESEKLEFAFHFKFPDHFHYKMSDIKYLQESVTDKNIDLLITTEKDYVKIKKLGKIDIEIIVLEIEFIISELKLLEEL
jgi:tetraacyldisaccharide 4'-kinase